MLSIHPFRFVRAFRKGHELDVDFTIPRHFRLSRNVAVCRSLRNVRIRSQIGNRSRFDRQTFVTGFSGNLRIPPVVVVCLRPCGVGAGVGCPTVPTTLGTYVQGRSPPLRQRVDPSSGSQGAGYRHPGQHRACAPGSVTGWLSQFLFSHLP